MAVKLLIGLLDPDGALGTDAYGAGAVIQVQRAADEAFTAPADVTEVAVQAATFAYVVWDASGDRSAWYRWRLEKGDDTETGEWSDPLQGWDPALPGRLSGSYANPDELLIRLGRRPTTAETERVARFDVALRDANERLTNEVLEMSFFRTPQSGETEVRLFDGDGTGVLHVHDGIVSLTGVRVKPFVTGDFEDVVDADWRLEYWANRGAPHSKPAGEPYDHVVFTGAGATLRWPGAHAGVELTGALGWPRVPRGAINAEIDLCRQMNAADPNFAGGPVGPSELGRPTGPNLLPRSVYDLQTAMARRHWCHL